MSRGAYSIVNEMTEDRFDETYDLDSAVQIARDLVAKSPAGDAISIEHQGFVVRQLRMKPGGEVEEIVAQSSNPSAGLAD